LSARIGCPVSTAVPTSSPEPTAQDYVRQTEAFWAGLPRKGLFFGMLAAWVLLFHLLGNATLGYTKTTSLFGWMDYAYRMSQDDELGRFVPLIVLGLLWWRRDQLAALPKRLWTPALLLVGGALLLHVLAFAMQQTRLSIAAFYGGIWALGGVVWGPAWLRATLLPCSLFVFAVPLGTMGEAITFPLRMIATNITVWTSQNLLGIDVIQQGNQVFDARGHFQYEVAAACGGLRSLTATLALALIVALMNFNTSWRRAVMILSAFPFAVLGNVLRLTLIIVAAEAFGQEGGNYVHDSSWLSLLPYVPPFIGMALLSRWLREPDEARPPAEPPAAEATPQPA
jgi:exosortase